ncbi:MAG TPA: PA2169 family four-helix-bundle protein [Cyclobacteriaceae bacterium]|nr:PA2169 family four-helix-bundle protein [Cyclobacteriaceae bacterium]
MKTYWYGFGASVFIFQQNFITMKNSEKILEVLSDLIEINNDRIVGYERAVDGVNHEETSLKTLFYQLVEESRECKDALTKKLKSLTHNSPEETVVARGEVYKTWMNKKVKYTGNDTLALLSSCESAEDAIQDAYSAAARFSGEFPMDISLMISTQKKILKMSHDLIRSQREEHKLSVYPA